MAIALLALTSSGCVTRRLIIQSNPPGALVYIGDQEIGTTPVAVNYIYYGTRKIRLVKDGYETLTALEPIPAPWWDHFPLDFVSENMVPGELRDVRVLSYQMVPQMNVPPQELLGRAEELRRAGKGTPAPSVIPAVSELQPAAAPFSTPPANGQVLMPGAESPLPTGAAQPVSPTGLPPTNVYLPSVEYLPPAAAER
ncbi:MAG: PEGA domain-containing protein [Pirellulales bacterium]